jgi:hypothetical protein
MKWKTTVIGLAAALMTVAGAALYAQVPNPKTGSVWTYLGPATGPGWVWTAGIGNCSSIVAYGGVGDGVTDNTAAFNAAKAATRCIAFPEGRFRFNSALTYAFTANNQSLTITGAGQDVTVLYWPNAVGTALAITKTEISQTVHLRDFSMTTGTLNVDTAFASTQIKTNAAVIAGGTGGNDITRVTFRADEGYWQSGINTITHGWARSMYLRDSIWDIVGVHVFGPTSLAEGGYAELGGFGGIGLEVQTINTSVLPVVFNLDRCNFVGLEKAVVTGAHSQGWQISQSNFVGGYYGIYVPTVATSLTQVTVTGSQFNNHRNISINFPVAALIISNNLFYVTKNGIGVDMLARSLMTTITGNHFNGIDLPTGVGLNLVPDALDIVAPVVVGNTFYNINVGVVIGQHEFGLAMANNVFKGVTTNIVSSVQYALNQITGGTQTAQPVYAIVSSVVDNGSGVARLTVNSTVSFFSGQMVAVGGAAGISGIGTGQAGVTSIRVIDATHMDLLNIQFGGTYSGGGYVTSLP